MLNNGHFFNFERKEIFIIKFNFENILRKLQKNQRLMSDAKFRNLIACSELNNFFKWDGFLKK